MATVNYTGKLRSDNSIFDSTKNGAFSFVLGQAEVIECWDKGFKQINVGSKATIDCPADMSYGHVQKPGIPENSDLIFDVELLDCSKDEIADLNLDSTESEALTISDTSAGTAATEGAAGEPSSDE